MSVKTHLPSHPFADTTAKLRSKAAKGEKVVDMSFAGGFALEDSIFKALALGAPFTKLICMGRAVMIPGFLGANIEGVFQQKRKETLKDFNEVCTGSIEDREEIKITLKNIKKFSKKSLVVSLMNCCLLFILEVWRVKFLAKAQI